MEPWLEVLAGAPGGAAEDGLEFDSLLIMSDIPKFENELACWALITADLVAFETEK